MIRNTVFAAAAAVMMFAVVPAQAGVTSPAPTIAVEDGYKQDVGHWVQKCKIVRVKSYYGWKNVKKCRKVYVKHKQSYGY